MKRTMITLMAYENLAVGERARENWNFVAYALKHNCVSELRVWNFDALNHPTLNVLAVRDAVKAEMIIVATTGGAELPCHVTAWIEKWLPERVTQGVPTTEVTGVVVFLCFPFDEGSGGDCAISQFAYLQRAARKGSMGFLASTSNSSITPIQERMTDAVSHLGSTRRSRPPANRSQSGVTRFARTIS